MAKLSVSVPDDLVGDVRELGTRNVSAFVATAIRHELDRRRLFAFLDEIDGELGPVDEDEVAAFIDTFTEAAAAKTVARERRSGGRARPSRLRH